MRVILAARYRNRSARALANLDTLIEMARPYDVGGLRAFARDLERNWESSELAPEGRTDSSEEAIEIVTIHSSKGLEWPVVIPINTATRFKTPEPFIHRQSDDTLHWVIEGVRPVDLLAAREEEEQNEARERERMWYVACTRARDLLILPQLGAASGRSWARIMDLGQVRLPEFDVASLPAAKPVLRPRLRNRQTAEVFAAQAARVFRASTSFEWRRPSDKDHDRQDRTEVVQTSTDEVSEAILPSQGGRLRGIVLHKMMEELLTGEIVDEPETMEQRARELVRQLVLSDPEPQTIPDPAEVAATALRTLRLREIVALRPQLVPEVPVWADIGSDVLVAGRADAFAMEGERIVAVLDWKSDLAPADRDRNAHIGQLSEYLLACGVEKGALVYMSLAEVVWVSGPPA